MNDKTDNINRETLIVVSTYIGGFLIGYVFNVLLARMLAPNEYGNFKVAEAFVGLGSILVLMGGSKAAAIIVTEDVLNGESKKVWAYIWFYLKVVFLASISLFALSIVGNHLHISIFEGETYHPVLLASLTIPFSAASALVGCVFLITKKLGWAFVPWRIGFPLIRLILCSAVFLITGSLNDLTAVFIMAIAALLIFLFQFWHSIRTNLLTVAKTELTNSPQLWLKVSLPMMFIVIIQVLMTQVDIYMLEWLSGEEAVGHFAAAQTTAKLLETVKTSLYAFIAPAVVLSIKAGSESMAELNKKCFKLLCAIVLPLAFLIVSNADSILTWFGHNTELTYFALLFLTGGNTIDAILGLGVFWLQYSEHKKIAINVLLASLLANSILNFMLIPILDVEGAAIATSMVKSVAAIVMTLFVLNKYGIMPWGIFRRLGNKKKSSAASS